MKTTTSNDLSELYEILKNMHQQIATQNKEIAEMKKELDHHVRKTDTEIVGKHVTEKSQADPLQGRAIICPHCHASSVVYHFEWNAAKCQNPDCGDYIDKYEWLI